ncbi:diguanylate cyclase [Ruminococcaceae bacterium OttesenSCG-928-D13]|nr:diguanylate cyclase [Ruminococcaceae bacterium OttesenSCG-928-D13]
MLTDAVFITIYAALALVVIATTAFYAINGLHRKLSNTYFWISICVIGWLFANIAYHINADARYLEFFDNLAFPFIALLPVFLLQFTFRFYRGGRRVRERGYFLLSLVPAATSVISLVPSLNWLMREGYTVIQLYPLHITDYVWGLWFYVHAVYSYLLITVCCVVVIWQYNKRPREYRVPSVLLISGIGVAYLSNLPALGKPETILDTTLIGVCLSMIALYLAVDRNPAVAILATARKALYNNMDMPVFIMNKQERVLDMNTAARSMMGGLGVAHEGAGPMVFDEVTDAITNYGGAFKKGFGKDGLPHIFMNRNGEHVVYKQTRRELKDKRGKPVGSYVAMIDITGLRQTVDELQWKAEVDVLTGISNRRAFERKLVELDTPEHLPLSFIVGDLNRLKQVNDELGHKQGDMLLKSVANILTCVCPDDGVAARIGGDEFIMILPCCDSDEAQRVTDLINSELAHMKEQFMGASIALGSVTKIQPEQAVNALIHEADQLMYSQKRYDRRSRATRSERDTPF